MNREWKVIMYETVEGECPVKDFILSRNDDNRDKILAYIDYLADVGIDLHRPQADYLRDGIHELRIKLSGDETRTLYFFCFENYIILTHTFVKRTQEVPNAEIEKALRYKIDFIQRYNINTIDEDYNATI
jgi:phage-related protein